MGSKPMKNPALIKRYLPNCTAAELSSPTSPDYVQTAFWNWVMRSGVVYQRCFLQEKARIIPSIFILSRAIIGKRLEQSKIVEKNSESIGTPSRADHPSFQWRH